MKHDEDPVVEKVQKVRKAIFKEFGYDAQKLGSHLQSLSKIRKIKHGEKRPSFVFTK